MRKSDRTKATILAAARQRFSEAGYDGATIRAIATAADIDPSMVMRYFGSKEQLFAAAAEFDLRIPDFAEIEPADLGAGMVRHFLERWEDDEALVLLLRSATTNADAAQRMQQIFQSQLGPAVAAVNPSDAARRAGLIASQMLGVALCRLVLRLPPMVAMSRAELESWLGPTVQRYLTGSPEDHHG